MSISASAKRLHIKTSMRPASSKKLEVPTLLSICRKKIYALVLSNQASLLGDYVLPTSIADGLLQFCFKAFEKSYRHRITFKQEVLLKNAFTSTQCFHSISKFWPEQNTIVESAEAVFGKSVQTAGNVWHSFFSSLFDNFNDFSALTELKIFYVTISQSNYFSEPLLTPPELKILTQIQVLEFFQVEMSSNAMQSIANHFSHLKELSFKQTPTATTFLSFCCEMPQLKKINIDHLHWNPCFLHNCFRHASHLTINELTTDEKVIHMSPAPSFLQVFPNLTHLTFPIPDPIIFNLADGTVQNYSTLRELTCSLRNLNLEKKGKVLDFFRDSFTSLQKLDISLVTAFSGNKKTTSSTKKYKKIFSIPLSQLSSLKLYLHPFPSELLTNINHLVALKSLHIKAATSEHFDFKDLKNLPDRIEHLIIDIPKQEGHMPMPRTPEEIAHLTHLQSLKTLSMDPNPTAEAKTALLKKIPQLKITDLVQFPNYY